MADRIDDSADLAVEELRRKARRRLLGAIVLALAAAILLPLLLEKDQRPLGEDVSIQIPPVDNGKFISRLTPEKASDPKDAKAVKADAKIAAAPVESSVSPPSAPVPAAKADAPLPAGSASAGDTVSTPTASPDGATATAAAPSIRPTTEASAPAADLVAPPKPASATPSAAAPAAAAAAASGPETAPPAAPTAASAAATLEAATPPPAPASESSRHQGFIIQLAAFTDDKGANSLANKVRKLGYPAYVEPVQTATRGTLWRVRVGGYPSRAAAVDVLAKLKAQGHNGLVSAAK